MLENRLVPYPGSGWPRRALLCPSGARVVEGRDPRVTRCFASLHPWLQSDPPPGLRMAGPSTSAWGWVAGVLRGPPGGRTLLGRAGEGLGHGLWVWVVGCEASKALGASAFPNGNSGTRGFGTR